MTATRDGRPFERIDGTIVIQGGQGSFNHSAVLRWLDERSHEDAEIRFARSTDEVLESVEAGRADLGQFAIHNSAGGFYRESLDAIGRHRFTVLSQHSYPITHSLLAHPESEGVDTIVTHEEVLKHCEINLATRFKGVRVEIGSGELHDPASVARAIAAGRLPPSTATISNPRLAQVHGLRELDAAMHDRPSASVFLIVGPAQDR